MIMIRRYISTKKLGNFVDFISIRVQGGTGGDGAAHFAKEPFKHVAPPDGGDGGNGGNVFVKVINNGNDLSKIQKRVTAYQGGRGTKLRGRGKTGNDEIILVPKGTIIQEYIPKTMPIEWGNANVVNGSAVEDFHEECCSDIKLPHESLYIDTSHPLIPIGSTFQVAAHGRGGFGNAHFATPENRTPMEFTCGKPGQVRYLKLELKTIADVGLVGLPNAGKSSFLQSVSRCKTGIGSWAFTTLNPFLGTIRYTDSSYISSPPLSVTIADIPGIIKGAAEFNRGLGHSFLRHIEKSKLQVYVIDLTRPDPFEDLQTLFSELETYKVGLAYQKRGLVVANKADIGKLDENEDLVVQKQFKNLCDKLNQDERTSSWNVVPISAKYKKNVSKVLWHIREIVLKEREKEEAELDSLMKLQNNTIGRYIWETPEFIRGVRNITVPENACSK